MHTQCPECKTRFRVNDDQLRIAHGQVRCSRCHVIFNALETLKTEGQTPEVEYQAETILEEFEELKAQVIDDDPCPFEDSDLEELIPEPDIQPVAVAETITPEAESDSVLDDELSEVLRELEKLEQPAEHEPEAEPAAEKPATTEEVSDAVPDSDADATEEQLPEIQLPDITEVPSQKGVKDQLLMEEILGQPQPARKSGGLWWSLGIIAMLVVALSQLAWHGRDRLMHFSEGRWLLQNACQYLGCQLPVIRAPEQIQVLSRSITSHPQVEDALLIQLTIANKANFSQPYPVLQISLFSSEEQLVVQRRFNPQEYLAENRGDGQLDPGQAIYVELEIEDPGNDVTGFKLEFF